MNKQTRHKPTASKFSLRRQLCNLIPNHLVLGLARDLGVKDQARTFSPWSHVVSRLFTLLRSALWQKLELRSLLENYGTAGVHKLEKTRRSLKPFFKTHADLQGKQLGSLKRATDRGRV
jgi:hypothetical protein